MNFCDVVLNHASDVLRITSPSPFSKSVGQSGEKAARSHCKFLWILNGNGKNYSLLVFSPPFLRSPPSEHRALLFERLEQARFSDSSPCTEELTFRIPRAVFRIPQAKISRIPESRFPYMGWKIWRLVNNRTIARWRHFTTTTRILEFVVFLCKLRLLFFNPQRDWQIQITKQNRNEFWLL